MRNSTVILTFLFVIQIEGSKAQTVIFDPGHFAIVNENAAARLGAENAYNGYLNNIRRGVDDIYMNVNSVTLVQTMIHNSLTQVNQTLKSGIATVQIARLSSEIIQESNSMLALAGTDPYLLLFAEDVARQMKSRGLRLISEVSDFVLKEGNNVMMDYEKRDALLGKIILELKVMRALCYSMSRSMYWAKINGILKTANPYRNFINQDVRMADDILRGYEILKE